MPATAFKDVIQKAVKKGAGVKKEVLEEIAIEDEVKKERELDREIERRIQKGELSKVKYPYGDDERNPVTMVRNPEDEVYGNLPMPFKVDINDAVSFIEAWDNAKPTDMRAAFLRSHLTNTVKDEYFDELRKRLEVAKRQGNTQITMPTPSPKVIEEMENKNMKEEKGSNDDLAATLAPLITLQKIMDEDKKQEPQEKPTEIVKTIMETAKGISEGKGNQETPTAMVKGIIEVAKELNTDKGGALNPIDVSNAIIAAAETLSQSKHPEAQQNPDILQQILAVSELVNTLSNKGNGDSTGDKIQVPREDGSVMEMTVQQYMLSEMLKTKLSNAQQPQPTQEQRSQSDTIQIQDPDGTVRTMPATTYISELALKRMSEKEAQTPKRASEAERVSQDNTKLMAALVATVERLSSEVSNLKAHGSDKDDPILMMDTMLAQGEKIDNFRRRFLGGGLTEEDKEREKKELEAQRAHELKIAQMQTQQANRSALTNFLNPAGGGIAPSEEPTTQGNKQQQPSQTGALDEKLFEKEAIRESQRKAEKMIENLAREKALAEKMAEERVNKQKVRQRINATTEREAAKRIDAEAIAKAKKKEEEANVKVKDKEKVRKGRTKE